MACKSRLRGMPILHNFENIIVLYVHTPWAFHTNVSVFTGGTFPAKFSQDDIGLPKAIKIG